MKITFREMTGVEVTVPLIEDVSMAIAQKYGMIMPSEDSTKAVRAVFVIDPAGADEGVTCVDWFLCTKELTTEQIDAAIRGHEVGSFTGDGVCSDPHRHGCTPDIGPDRRGCHPPRCTARPRHVLPDRGRPPRRLAGSGG